MANESDSSHSASNRGISVDRDANGNVFVTGDHNHVVVTIYEAAKEDRTTQSTTESDLGPNPYLGLLSFHAEDADRFFGRTDEISELLAKLRDLQIQSEKKDGPSRFLPILGPSGSGKSSLARAGLIPELARNPIGSSRKSSVVVLTPGSHPLESLARVLAKIATNDPAPTQKTREFAAELDLKNSRGEYDGLRRITDDIAAIAESHLYLLVDQFEEVYSLCEDQDERNAFLSCLLHAAGDRGGKSSVIVTFRTDFLGETQSNETLNQLICKQGVMVPAMSESQLIEAIAEPAKRSKYTFDQSTIELLVRDAKGRDGALPLLQFALQRIWSGLEKGVDAAQTYTDIGGLGGALAGEAQRIFDKELNEAEQKIARRVFLGLVQLGEGTRDTRRRAVVENLIPAGQDPDSVEQVLRRFAKFDARLITLSGKQVVDSAIESNQTAEVTHEALFDHWAQLKDWLKDGREDLRYSRRLEETAETWKDQGYPAGSLWSRTPDIDNLRKFYGRCSDDLSELQLKFYRASDEAEIEYRKAQEEDRRKKLKTAEKLAEQQREIAEQQTAIADRERQVAENQKKRKRQAIYAFFGCAFLAGLAFGFMLKANFAEKLASDESKKSKQGQIIAQIDSLLFAPSKDAAIRLDKLAEIADTDSSLYDFAIENLEEKINEEILENVEINKYTEASWNEYDQLQSGKANLVAALVKFGESKRACDHLKHSSRPDLCSYSIERIHQMGVSVESVVKLLEFSEDPGALMGSIYSVGNFAASDFSDNQLNDVVDQLMNWFKTHPDSGVHSAAEWALRKWIREKDDRLIKRGLGPEFTKVNLDLDGKKPANDQTWLVEQGQTMVVVKPPANGIVQIGSPESERGRSEDEKIVSVHIDYQFLVATTEVTDQQFSKFLSDETHLQGIEIEDFDESQIWQRDQNPSMVNWYTAVAYCNWLTKQEYGEQAVTESFYAPKLVDGKSVFGEGMAVKKLKKEDGQFRQGYRLLTDVEWEYACRAGTTTRFSFGESSELLRYFAQRGGLSDVGILKSNGFGLFDVHGNAWEWTQSRWSGTVGNDGTGKVANEGRVLRGGSFYLNEGDLRSAFRYSYRPFIRNDPLGFRVARTYP